MLHTSALHVNGEAIVCTCGRVFIDGHPRPDYVLAFATHLTDANRMHYGP